MSTHQSDGSSLQNPCPQGTRSLAFLGCAPLAPGEDNGQYQEILQEVSEALGPKDGLEWLAVVEIVDETWQVMRLRRAISVRMALATRETVADLVLKARKWRASEGCSDDQAAHQIADSFMRKDAEGRQIVPSCLGSIGLQERDLVDAATAAAFPVISQMQSLIGRRLDAREHLLRGLDRRRANLAKRLRASLKSVEAKGHDH